MWVAAVVLVAANGHRVAGILAAVSATVWFDFFLAKPYEHFSISGRTDIETTVLLVVGLPLRARTLWRAAPAGVDGRIGTLDCATWDVDQFGMPDTEVELIAATQGTLAARLGMAATGGLDGQRHARKRAWRASR